MSVGAIYAWSALNDRDSASSRLPVGHRSCRPRAIDPNEERESVLNLCFPRQALEKRRRFMSRNIKSIGQQLAKRA